MLALLPRKQTQGEIAAAAILTSSTRAEIRNAERRATNPGLSSCFALAIEGATGYLAQVCA